MLPQVFLLLLGNPATLLVTYFDDLGQNVVKLFNVFVRSLHVLEGIVEERVHNVGAQVHQHLLVKFDRLVVVLVSLVKDSARLIGPFLLTDLQALVDWEVAARDVVYYLGLVLLAAENLNKLEQQVDVHLRRLVPIHDIVAALALIDYVLFVL